MTTDRLGEVDVCFVIDTTASMSPFIVEARAQARAQVARIAAAGDLDVRYAIVAYRDHPPQDHTFVTWALPFGDGAAFDRGLMQLSPQGGGDIAEAVLDGLVAAANLPWRETADRLCFLIGDAPPHGLLPGSGISGLGLNGASYDGFAEGCPCRATPGGVVELLAGRRITLHAILLGGDPQALASFRDLATGTTGTFAAVDDVRASTAAIGTTVGIASTMVNHARHYSVASASLGTTAPGAVGAALGWTPEMVEGVTTYMSHRGIDPGWAVEKPRPRRRRRTR